ncbi:uncharacterized protein LOC115464189 [Microcaecilia unicolor]|uniref:Uncharacterized protein LOC115464189 n=1 Tax=Microcaecilia unicolor TaxID=1415580 RepID=A0A6P7X495_9AMPH|nr:uncharacterized protein LOC115464189 [Microcaecilia unicolor]
MPMSCEVDPELSVVTGSRWDWKAIQRSEPGICNSLQALNPAALQLGHPIVRHIAPSAQAGDGAKKFMLLYVISGANILSPMLRAELDRGASRYVSHLTGEMEKKKLNTLGIHHRIRLWITAQQGNREDVKSCCVDSEPSSSSQREKFIFNSQKFLSWGDGSSAPQIRLVSFSTVLRVMGMLNNPCSRINAKSQGQVETVKNV